MARISSGRGGVQVLSRNAHFNTLSVIFDIQMNLSFAEEPNTIDSSRDCVSLDTWSGEWVTQSCDSQLQFVCKIRGTGESDVCICQGEGNHNTASF